jgi:hypothetical protein
VLPSFHPAVERRANQQLFVMESLRDLLCEVVSLRHKEDEYDFSDLPAGDEERAIAESWTNLEARIEKKLNAAPLRSLRLHVKDVRAPYWIPASGHGSYVNGYISGWVSGVRGERCFAEERLPDPLNMEELDARWRKANGNPADVNGKPLSMTQVLDMDAIVAFAQQQAVSDYLQVGDPVSGEASVDDTQGPTYRL